jgi:hypothetical protein
LPDINSFTPPHMPKFVNEQVSHWYSYVYNKLKLLTLPLMTALPSEMLEFILEVFLVSH